MKIGKTILQIYSAFGMFVGVLMVLAGLGMGLFSMFIPNITTILGFGGGILFILLGVGYIFLYYNLFNFKNWARLVVTLLVALGMLTSLLSGTLTILVLIDIFILYLLWMDKDTIKAFRGK